MKVVLALACFALALASALFAFEHVDRMAEAGEPAGIVAAMSLFFVFGFASLVLLLQIRQPKPAAARAGAWRPSVPEGGLKAGVYGLIPGAKYRVIREIVDCYGGTFAPGEELVFVSRDYLPYHGGHTVVFEPRTMYFQDEDSAAILSALDTYLEPVVASGDDAETI